jgi:hypothetical protein
MRTNLRRGLTIAALAGACTIAVAPAALAQPTTSPEAFGMGASGLITLGDTPNQTTFGTTSATNATVLGLVNATALTATVNGQNSTAAQVATLNTTGITTPILGTISATAISTSCVANANGTFTGTTSITNLNILGASFSGTATSPDSLTVNTPLGLTSISVTVDAEQAGPMAGSEEVDGIQIVYSSPVGTETIDVADATCGPYTAGVPLASGKGLAAGLAGVGLFGLGFGAVYIRRRHALAV